MSDRDGFRATLKSGLLGYDTRLNEMIKKFQGGELPSYPFAAVSFVNNGMADYEVEQRYPEELVEVDNTSDPDFDKDIEKRYQDDFFFTVSIDVVGESSDPVSEIAQNVEGYARYKLDEDLDNDGIDMVVREINSVGQSHEFLEGQNERRHTVDVRMLTDLTDTLTLKTIETLEFDSNSGLFPGEQING